MPIVEMRQYINSKQVFLRRYMSLAQKLGHFFCPSQSCFVLFRREIVQVAKAIRGGSRRGRRKSGADRDVWRLSEREWSDREVQNTGSSVAHSATWQDRAGHVDADRVTIRTAWILSPSGFSLLTESGRFQFARFVQTTPTNSNTSRCKSKDLPRIRAIMRILNVAKGMRRACKSRVSLIFL